MELLLKYFPELTPTQVAQYTQAVSLYKEWNARINVISRKDMEHFVLHHLLHSLGIAKIHPLSAGQKVLDVGTGGGFPRDSLGDSLSRGVFPLGGFHR